MLLIDDLIGLPAKGLIGIFKALYQKAYEELYDPERIKEELQQLQIKLDAGEISEETYDAHEELLLDRLDEIYREQSGA